LLWLSYMADTELFGTGPFGYHLTNILLHTLNAALLFWVLFRMTGSRWRSAWVAALFALHPLRVESVAWIAERKDVLSGLFFLLGLLAYRRYVEVPVRSRFWLLPALMLLGLLSKGILIVFPFVLLLLDFWPLQRATALWSREAVRQWGPLLREKIPLFALTLTFVFINLRTHGAASPVFNPVPLVDRLGLIFPNYWAYLRQIFWPLHLAILHPENDIVHWSVSIAALVGLVGLTALAWSLRSKRPYLLFGWLWFLLILFPVVRGIRYSLASIADRFTYLPSIGLTLAVVWTVADLGPRGRRQSILMAGLAALLLAACIWQTRAVMPFWKDSFAAFGNVLHQAPDNAFSNNNYGEFLMEHGRIQASIPYLEKAVAGNPQATPFASNLGLALLLLHRPDEALQCLDAARQRVPATTDCDHLDFSTGLVWMEKNEPHKAIPFFQNAVGQVSNRPTWRAELARAYRDAGQMQAYSNELARIVADGFPNLGSYGGLCIYYLGLWQHGHGRRSWTFFQREIERDPGNVQLMNNAAWFLAIDPPAGASVADALALAQQAHGLAGDVPDLLDTLALAHAANGQFDEAIRRAEQAQAIARGAGNGGLVDQVEARLQAFRAGRMWRPPPL
jgi:tetratricopeptide (TPR) repeat protein